MSFAAFLVEKRSDSHHSRGRGKESLKGLWFIPLILIFLMSSCGGGSMPVLDSLDKPDTTTLSISDSNGRLSAGAFVEAGKPLYVSYSPNKPSSDTLTSLSVDIQTADAKSSAKAIFSVSSGQGADKAVGSPSSAGTTLGSASSSGSSSSTSGSAASTGTTGAAAGTSVVSTGAAVLTSGNTSGSSSAAGTTGAAGSTTTDAGASSTTGISALADQSSSIPVIKVVSLTDSLPALLLPDSLAVGFYKIVLTLHSATADLTTTSIPVFVVKDASAYSIRSITSTPPAVSSGQPCFLSADILAPDGSNPYLRWSVGKTVIGEASLADGGDQISWTVPEKTGMYSVTLELFPVSASSSFAFTSAVSQTVKVAVDQGASSVAASATELGPESSYYALFHFSKDLQDVGIRSRSATVSSVSSLKSIKPVLRSYPEGVGFGYEFTGSFGVDGGDFLLPIENGALAPFTVVIRAYFKQNTTSASLLTTSNDGFTFSIVADSAGGLAATLVSGDTSITSSAGTYLRGAHEAAITVLPSGTGSIKRETMDILWFVDGQLVHVDREKAGFTGMTKGQASYRIGGIGAYQGILDELGIYTRNDAGISTSLPFFQRESAKKYRNALLYAAGFDGAALDKGVSVSGEASLVTNGLSLGKGGTVTFPDLELPESSFRMRAEFDATPSRAAFLDVFSASSLDGKPLASIPVGGSSGFTDMLAYRTQGGFTLVASGMTDKAIDLSSGSAKLRLVLRSAGDDGIRLTSFLVVSEPDKVAPPK
jgi:hypothetical protein